MNKMNKLVFFAAVFLLTSISTAAAQQLSWEDKMKPQYQLDLKKMQAEEALEKSSKELSTVVLPAQNPQSPTDELAWREHRREELLGYITNLQNSIQTPEVQHQTDKYMQALRQNEDKIGALRAAQSPR
jgi:predicted RND superfamily exporter protein